MKKAHLLIAAAFLVHAVAWLLPVVKEGVTLPDGLPGWQAFEMAASEVNKGKIDPWYFVVLSTLSAVTTILFVLGAGWVVALGSRKLCRISAWIAAGAFIINAHWVLWSGPDRFNLRVGDMECNAIWSFLADRTSKSNKCLSNPLSSGATRQSNVRR